MSLLIQFYYPELVEQNVFQYTFDIMDEKWDFLYYQGKLMQIFIFMICVMSRVIRLTNIYMLILFFYHEEHEVHDHTNSPARHSRVYVHADKFENLRFKSWR